MNTNKFFSILTLCVMLSIVLQLNAAPTVILPTIPSGTFQITNYGANPKSINNTSAIQAAINACALAGGGTVNIPPDTFLCGPLVLKAKVNLHISKGAVLKVLPYGSGNGTDLGTYPNNGNLNSYNPFISATSVNNVKISGSGTVDGQGSDWWTAYSISKAAGAGIGRPCMITWNYCNYVQVDSITIINAPNVHMSVGKGCSHSTISNVTVNSPDTSPNTDGLDVWSPYVNVTNCNISCGDDNIAMDNNSSYVTVKHCTFGTGHGCSIGSYASNIRYVLVDSCTFNGTSNGMRLKTSRDRGGVEEYITYSNCTMNNVGTAFGIASYYPKTPAIADTVTAMPVTASTPTWRHITIKNITVNSATIAAAIYGLPEMPITDLVFDNVKINASGAFGAYYVKDLVFKNGSSVTIPSSAKIDGRVVDMFATNVTGIDVLTGAALTNIYQTINLGTTDNIATTLKNKYDGSSTDVSVVFPAGYANPAGTSTVDLTTISTNIKNLAFMGDGSMPVVKTLQFNPPAALNSLRFKGLTLTGVDNGSSVGSTFLFYPNTSGTTVGEFTIDSCMVRNYYGVIRVGALGTGFISSIIINNSIVRNLGGYGLMSLGNSSYAYKGTVVLKNSTLCNIQASLIYAPYSKAIPISILDCTIDNVLNSSTGNLFLGAASTTPCILNISDCLLGRTLSSSSAGITNATIKELNSYKTSDWVNGTNTTSDFTSYSGAASVLFKSPSVYNSSILTSSTMGDYTIIDSGFAGKDNAGDPRWYYKTITPVDTSKATDLQVYVEHNIIHLSQIADVDLYSISGVLVKSGLQVQTINTAGLPKGGYIVKARSMDGVKTQKIVL